jgi:SAM-dependent methyltransferase
MKIGLTSCLWIAAIGLGCDTKQETLKISARTSSIPSASDDLPAAEITEISTHARADAPRKPDVIYVPTPQPVVDKMLDLARVKSTDLVYDLGCGDGRIVVTAAKRYGARAVGFDIDPERVAEAKENVRNAGVEDLVRIEQKDIFTLDLAPANVVTLYLLPQLNVKLIPQLERMKPGSRIVSHDFDIEGVEPLETRLLRGSGAGAADHAMYLFEIPLKKQR